VKGEGKKVDSKGLLTFQPALINRQARGTFFFKNTGTGKRPRRREVEELSVLQEVIDVGKPERPIRGKKWQEGEQGHLLNEVGKGRG